MEKMNTQNSSDPHPLYLKDYSKLEIIFNAAVEKMNQKKIVYYASDRIFSEDSRKQILKNSFKSFACAIPLSAEDIQTEIIDLEKNKKLLPISQTISNNEASLYSLLEIVGEKQKEENKTTEFKTEVVEAKEENLIIDSEETKEKTQPILQETEQVESNSEVVISKTAQEKLERYYLLKEQTLNSLEEQKKNTQESLLENVEEADDLLINNKEFQSTLDQEELDEILSEISAEEIIEDLDDTTIKITEAEPVEEKILEVSKETESLESKESNSQDLYQQLLELSYQPQTENKDEISSLIASIQEDDSYLMPSNKAENSDSEKNTQFSEYTDSEYLIRDYLNSENNFKDNEELNSYKTESSSQSLEENEVEPSDEVLTNQFKTPINSFDSLTKEISENNFVEKKTNLLFGESSDESDKVTLSKRIKQTHKDLVTSRLTFLISLLLTGCYIFLMFRSFQGFDYIALVLTLVGIFLAWDLKAKPLTIVTIGMLVVLVGCVIYQSINTGTFIDVTHLVWFLLVPLNISSSYLFMNNRKEYIALLNINKEKDHSTETQDNQKKNESIFYSE